MNPLILLFSDPPGELSSTITARDFADSPLAKSAAMILDALRTRFVFDRCTIAGQTFHATIAFQSQKLDRLELFLILPNEKPGWENWSEQSERRRKEEAERWLSQLFAAPVDIKPLELDGEWIIPFERTWDATRGIRFCWGEALSFFDSKGGSSGILFLFTPPSPPTPP